MEEEEEEGSSLFSSKPKIFKMERRSPQASRLKASVLRKLLDFLDNYTDDDLAEYIVVLVCNGKNQNQTRDDLEEFLGDASGRFVTWLWNLLSNEIYLPKAPLTDSIQGSDSKVKDANNVDKEHRTSKEIKIENSSPLPNTESHVVSNVSSHSAFSNSLEVSEDLQCSGLKGDSLSAGANFVKSDQHTSQIHKASGTSDYNVHQTKGAIRSEIRSFVDIPAANIKSHSFEDEDHKTCKVHDEASQCQRFSHKKEVASRSFKSAITGISTESGPLSVKHAGGRPLSNSLDLMQHENSQSRRSVWDRLGKPPDGYNVKFNAEIEGHASNPVKRKRTCSPEDIEGEDRSECLDLGFRQVNRVSGEKAISFKNCVKVMPKRQADDIQVGSNAISGIKAVNDTINLKQRRYPIEANNGNNSLSLSDHGEKDFLTKETHKNMQRTLSTTCNSLQSLKDLLPVHGSANCSSKITNMASSRRPESTSTTPVETLVPGINSLTTKQENVDSEAGKLNHKPVNSGILDLNSQLHEVQKELLELRSKQAQIFKSAKHSSLAGSQNQYEDIDSRTAFVSNVHFAASREALSLHFSKCGPVAKVTILTDMLTGHPKGCAYIAFTNKDSLEKAILLDGTSFMSRTLKVMRKAEMPEGVLEPGPSSPQAWYPQFQRKHPNSHRQWRREQLGSAETSASSGPS